jgi:hypothetical protein
MDCPPSAVHDLDHAIMGSLNLAFLVLEQSPGIRMSSMDSNTTGFTLTLPAQLPQPLIIYAKVMRYLVSDGAMDNPASIFPGAGVHFDGALVDADSIRQYQAIVMGALCLRDTVVET